MFSFEEENSIIKCSDYAHTNGENDRIFMAW